MSNEASSSVARLGSKSPPSTPMGEGPALPRQVMRRGRVFFYCIVTIWSVVVLRSVVKFASTAPGTFLLSDDDGEQQQRNHKLQTFGSGGTSESDLHLQQLHRSPRSPPRIVLLSSSADAGLHSLTRNPSPVTDLTNATSTVGNRHHVRVYEEEESAHRRKHPPKSDDRMVKPAVQIYSVAPRFDVVVNGTNTTTKSQCVPMREWQVSSHPTCNDMHEMDLVGTRVRYLGQGSIRSVWKVVTSSPTSFTAEPLVLKTLRYSGRGVQFDPQRYESHRRDAVASERLTSSPRVVDVFSYCGQSCVNEKLDSNLQKFHGRTADPRRKLRVARDAALALADVHGVDSSSEFGSGDGDRATIVHRDVTHRNFLLAKDGTVVINDFNVCRFPEMDVRTNETCLFKKPDCGPYRSPEECRHGALTEKIDIYSLGNTFYYILTGKEPYRYPGPTPSSREIERRILNGTISHIPSIYDRSEDEAVVALVRAIRRCLSFEPADRPTAREVAEDLTAVLDGIHESRQLS